MNFCIKLFNWTFLLLRDRQNYNFEIVRVIYISTLKHARYLFLVVQVYVCEKSYLVLNCLCAWDGWTVWAWLFSMDQIAQVSGIKIVPYEFDCLSPILMSVHYGSDC